MYCDLHLHILPKFDDGAFDLREALAMASVLAEHGWSRAVATPHIRMDLFPNDPRDVVLGVERLSDAIAEAHIPVSLVPGAEHFLDEVVMEMLLAHEGVPLGGGGDVYLVEAPMTGPMPGLESHMFRLRLAGITPLVAHPERCSVFHDVELVRRLRETGVHFQLSLGSLSSFYGRRAKVVAGRLLSEGLYSVAATDLHSIEDAQGRLDGWVRRLQREAGTRTASLLLSENPERLLAGETRLSS